MRQGELFFVVPDNFFFANCCTGSLFCNIPLDFDFLVHNTAAYWKYASWNSSWAATRIVSIVSWALIGKKGVLSPLVLVGWNMMPSHVRTKVYKISKYETIRETWDGIFMTCGSRVAPWVSVRLLLAEYMRKLPYNRSRTREAELMLRLCPSFEQWGCVGAVFKLCSAFSEIIRCYTPRCKDSVSRWSSGWTGSNTKKFARHNWLSMFQAKLQRKTQQNVHCPS